MGLERPIQNSSVKSVLVVNRTKYLKDTVKEDLKEGGNNNANI